VWGSPRSKGVHANGGASRASEWPLVGRSGEIDAFRSAFKDQQLQAFLVHGPAGTGKTRLAYECIRLAGRENVPCTRAVASDAARAIPLGAIAHLLPADIDLGDLAALFARMADRYRDIGQRVVLFVDDMHLLDATSAVLIGQLVDAGHVFLVGTIRSAAGLPEAVAGLDRSERARRVDLAELSLDEVHTLLAAVLGGPVELGTSFRLHQASGGVLLFLHELVRGGLDTGALVGSGGVWRMAGAPAKTRRLADLVRGRIRGVGEKDRAVLDIVALCGPVGTHGLDLDALSRLDRMGLVKVSFAGRRTTADLAHPLYGEVLRAELSVLERQGLLMGQVERLESTGMRRGEDRWRLAMMQLDATGTADPELLAHAAHLARGAYDFGSVARLATALTRQVAGGGPRMMLGEALYELGRFEEADAALREATAAAGSDEEYLLATLLHTQILAWAMLRIDAAMEVTGRARTRLADQDSRDALRLSEAALLAFVGEVARALPLVERLDAVADPRNRIMGAIPAAYVLAESGRCAEAIALARDAHTEHLGMTAVLTATHPGLHVGAQVMALVEMGRLDEARRLGEDAYACAVADKALIAQMWLAIYLGGAEYCAGRMARARGWFSSAAAIARDHHFRGGEWHALTGVALAAAGMGELEALDAAWRQATRLAPANHRRAIAVAVPGWRLALTGNLSEARDALADTAEMARSTGSLATEAILLSDIARLGDPARVRDRLAELAAATEWPLAAARSSHAAALAARDRRLLEQAAARFEAMGVVLLAAESYLSAAEFHRAAGDRRGAASADAHAARLAARCGGARMPKLSVPASHSPLTAREREIALMAAGRLSSQEIADRLVISIRTVDSHLRQVYRKTGVTSRKELHGLMHVLLPGRSTQIGLNGCAR
jgi:DNA-binding CsgD family transcriptional regulator/tetratricopeptide (TPR) repeat protein